MGPSPLRLLTVACLALTLNAGHGNTASPDTGTSFSTGVSAEIPAPLEGWDEDEPCRVEDGEQCALSLRQLRGRARQREVEEQRQQAQSSREGVRTVLKDPEDTILGIPLYRHGEQVDKLGAYYSPWTVNWRPRQTRWIVNVNEANDLGVDNDQQQELPPFWFFDGLKETLERELQQHVGTVGFVEEDAVLQMVPEIEVIDEPDEADDMLGVAPDSAVPAVDSAGPEQPPRSWGLDRIDAKDGLDHWYEAAGYGGKGIHVYMLDTGISSTHKDFGGRAIPTLEVNGDGLALCSGTNASCAADTLGHGTHTAGTVAGRRYGVAKAATLHAVKTLDDRGSGMISWMVQALHWVMSSGERPAIISASLGGHYESPSLTRAVDRSVERGITVVVAAGNENDDACSYMPSKVPSTITVGATSIGDTRAKYSNFGSCVDIFAPGTAIASAGIDSNTAEQRLSGTSMACPHVTGAAALLLAQDPTRTPADVKRLLLSEATKDKVHNPEGSPNLLLYTEPPFPRPVPLGNPARFEVYDGPCAVDADGCVSSGGFPEQGYGNSESCNILVLGDVGHMHVAAFDTERSFDNLVVNSNHYSGSLNRGTARTLQCVKPIGAISWSSDRTDTRSGWKVCPELKPPPDAARGFFVACGLCTTDANGCVASPHYPGNYSNREACYIDVVGDVEAIDVVDFDTEAGFDMLMVNGRNFSGADGPVGLKPTDQLTWSPDADKNGRGWKLCPGH